MTREFGAQFSQIATDLGVAKATLFNWVQNAEKESSPRPELSVSEMTEMTELRELRRRTKLLEHEAVVMRRAVGYLSREINPK